jgi:hypothetical protein
MATEKLDYAEIADDVMEVLDEVGADGVLIHVGEGVYDNETSDVVATETRTDVVAAFFPIDDRKVNGSTILEDDQTGIIGAVGVPMPEKGDTIEWGDQVFTIVGEPKKIAPARTTVVYLVQVRG